MTAVPIKTDLNVYINGIILAGLTDVKIGETREVKEAYEFLSDEAWAVIASYKKYLITLSFIGKKPVALSGNFSVAIESGNTSTVYNNCCVKSVNESYSNGKFTAEVKITSSEKE